MELENLKHLDIRKLLRYLVESGKSLADITVADLLRIVEERGLLEKEYPEPKKVPVEWTGRKIYMNLYDAEYTADIYEGTKMQTYSCYSLDEPITDPEILRQHHTYFYPDHEVVSIEWAGSYERETLGRAKLVYDPKAREWREVSD